jgi:4-methylaminobutanoate oxidase (formaldehyde-forming)
VTSAWSIVSLMGPRAEPLLARLSRDDVSKAALPFGATRTIDVGYARARAARMSYVGGPGYELYVPIEMARHVYLALHAASEGLGLDGGGLVDAGYFALDALRIEAGRRAWGAELGPDDTPFEAGAMFAVKLGKRDDFVGKAALLRLQAEPLRRKLVTVVLDSADRYAWAGESLSAAGAPVGEIASAGWSATAGRCVGLGYVRGALAAVDHAGTALAVDLWGEPVGASAWDSWRAVAQSRS